MRLSTVFWRPVNFGRGMEVRAKSRHHTSLLGLAKIYTKAAHLRTMVIDNIKERFVSPNHLSLVTFDGRESDALIAQILSAYKEHSLFFGNTAAKTAIILAVTKKINAETDRIKAETARKLSLLSRLLGGPHD